MPAALYTWSILLHAYSLSGHLAPPHDLYAHAQECSNRVVPRLEAVCGTDFTLRFSSLNHCLLNLQCRHYSIMMPRVSKRMR